MDGLVEDVYNKYGELIHEKKILQNINLNAVPSSYADVKRKSTLTDNRCRVCFLMLVLMPQCCFFAI